MRCLNKILILFAILISESVSLIAQPSLNDSSKVYQYWAKRGIIEMVSAYMDDYLEAVKDFGKSSIEKQGAKSFNDVFIKNIENKSIREIDSTFKIFSKFLVKNNWQAAEKNLFIPLQERYNSSKFIDKSFFEVNKPSSNDRSTIIPGHKNMMKNWNEVQSRIIKSYNKNLQELSNQSISKVDSPKQAILNSDAVITNNTYKAGNRIRPNNSNNYNWFNLIIYFLALCSAFLLGCYVVYQISKTQIFSILNKEEEFYLDEILKSRKRYLFIYIALVEKLKERKDDYKRKLDNFNKKGNIKGNENNIIKIPNLLKTKEKLEKENLHLIDNKSQLESPFDPQIKENHNELKQNEALNSIIFFTIPESDGSFIIEKGESSNDGRKLYRIEYLKNTINGQLYFISSDQDKRAINRLESYLKPVCEIENILLSASANKIELVNPGAVVLISDRWVIDLNSKVKIKLY